MSGNPLVVSDLLLDDHVTGYSRHFEKLNSAIFKKFMFSCQKWRRIRSRARWTANLPSPIDFSTLKTSQVINIFRIFLLAKSKLKFFIVSRQKWWRIRPRGLQIFNLTSSMNCPTPKTYYIITCDFTLTS